jgi:hypothetical protein
LARFTIHSFRISNFEFRIFPLLVLFFVAATCAGRADWRDELSPAYPGHFPALRPITLHYECGWAGLTAGHIEAQFSRPAPDICELDATAGTVGLARALWKMDATHEARGDMDAVRPMSVRQKEIYRAQTIRTDLDFDEDGVDKFRESTQDKKPARKRRYDFPDLYDLQTALLYMRSQKLETGDVYRIVVYPATTPYLATVTVLGRERIRVPAGSYAAIKMDLQLEKVTGDMTLVPHGKFKRATGWLSDDADRIPLRLNAQIFVGTVWVELAKAE